MNGQSDCQRLLAALRSGAKTHHELYALGMVVHSRTAELRRRGYRIDVDREDAPDGSRVYVYRLREGTAGAGRTQRSNARLSVKQAREGRGWSVRELSRRTDIAVSVLSLVERDMLVATPDQVLALSKAFGRPLVRRGRPTLRVAA